MPNFDKSTWSVGQAVVAVHRGRTGDEVYDGEITKIGRSWLTVKTQPWTESRYNFSGWEEASIGYRGQLWPSREVYEAHLRRQNAWRLLRKAVESSDAPDHLSLEDITSITAAVSPEA